MVPLFVVDGHNLLYRAWFGFPARITSRDRTRDLTGVFGFLALVRQDHALLAGGAYLDQLPSTPRLATRRCRPIVEMWPKVLAWRDLIRLDHTVPVAAGLVTGRPTLPLPLAARLVDQLGLW